MLKSVYLVLGAWCSIYSEEEGWHVAIMEWFSWPVLKISRPVCLLSYANEGGLPGPFRGSRAGVLLGHDRVARWETTLLPAVLGGRKVHRSVTEGAPLRHDRVKASCASRFCFLLALASFLLQAWACFSIKPRSNFLGMSRSIKNINHILDYEIEIWLAYVWESRKFRESNPFLRLEVFKKLNAYLFFWYLFRNLMVELN